jgi:hypothetical protein
MRHLVFEGPLGRPSRENKVKWGVTIHLTLISNDDRSDGTGPRIHSTMRGKGIR